MSDQLRQLLRATGAPVVIAICVVLTTTLVSAAARAIPAPPKPMVTYSDTKPMEDDYITPPGNAPQLSSRDVAPQQTVVTDPRIETILRRLHILVVRSLFNFLPR